MNLFLCLFIFGFVFIPAAHAQDENRLEVEFSHSDLNNGYSDWNDINVINYFGLKDERFVVETDLQNHFNETAGVIGLTWSHTYSPLWYQDLSLSYSTNDAILPGWIAFTELHRRLLENQSLVLGLGLGGDVYESPYSDTYGLAELVYYLKIPLALQMGTRLNDGAPGQVFTARYFGSVNLLLDRFDGYLRYEFGNEGYTIVGQNTIRNEFSSQEESAVMHYWYTQKMGVGVRADFYQSSFYNRDEFAFQWMMKY